jgi:Fe-S oxidoreductase
VAFNCSYHLEPFDSADLPRRFLDAFATILANSNYAVALETASQVAARCGRCATTCQVYQSSGEERDVPCERSELLLKIYRRYFTPKGALLGRFGGGFELTEQHLARLAEDLYRCSGCRRCVNDCPLGIDNGLITHLGRWALSEVGITPKALVLAVRAQLDGPTHNTSAIPAPAMADTVEFLAEDCADEHKVKIEFPLDVKDAEYIFFPAVSDYLLEPETLMGNAAVMAATKASWTIGSHCFDGINYGLFYSDRLHDRIIDLQTAELKRLNAKKILIGECGHASRAAHDFVRTFQGPDAPEVVNCLEYAYEQMKAGNLQLREGAIDAVVTYHDPCNIARSGWIHEQPREILRHIAREYVEMTPNRGENYCCGGGGGTVSIDEIRGFRTGVAGPTKADQIRRTGASIVVAPCANCKKQLKEVCEDNDLEHVQIIGLHDLILKALVPPPWMAVQDETDATEGTEAQQDEAEAEA